MAAFDDIVAKWKDTEGEAQEQLPTPHLHPKSALNRKLCLHMA